MAGDKNKLYFLRSGIPPHRRATLVGGDQKVEVMIVLLNSNESQEIDEMVEEYCQSKKDKVNSKVRSQYYNKLLCSYCMRDIEDPTYKKRIVTITEVGELMDVSDINVICKVYQELMMNKAPKLELLNADDYDEIKNYLGVTKLNDLSTVSLIHLKSFHLTLASEK